MHHVYPFREDEELESNRVRLANSRDRLIDKISLSKKLQSVKSSMPASWLLYMKTFPGIRIFSHSMNGVGKCKNVLEFAPFVLRFPFASCWFSLSFSGWKRV
jgi:hypothetical protein